jgi:hypothetical protein
MKIADILRTLANNLDHAQGGAPDPRIQNPAELIDVTVIADPSADQYSSGKTASGNDETPTVFMPPLQQKQELLKKAVGVENVYDDGSPVEQDNEPNDDSVNGHDIVDRIKKLSGIPTVAIQELSNDEVFDD